MKNQLVTIYSKSDFMGNIIKHEGKLIDFGTKNYAQYNNAPYVDFIPKRKRKGMRVMKTYQPHLIILSGVGHPEPDSMSIPTDNPMWEKSRYMSFDERWSSDFDSSFDQYIASNNITPLLDARHTKGFSSYFKNSNL